VGCRARLRRSAVRRQQAVCWGRGWDVWQRRQRHALRMLARPPVSMNALLFSSSKCVTSHNVNWVSLFTLYAVYVQYVHKQLQAAVA
jgi:hypothetical protein